MRPIVASALLAVLLLAGCSQPKDGATDGPAPSTRFGPATFDGDTLRVEVPVPVVMLGFPASTVQRMAKDLVPEEIVQQGYNHPFGFPPSLEGSSAETYTEFPVHPTAHYQVHAAPTEMEAAFFAFAAQAKAPNGTMFDGNRVEAWLAEHLPMHGFPVDPDAPTLVLLHGDGRLPKGHGWRYEYRNGYLDGIRSFGEQKPILVFDTTAAVDPYVGAGGKDYFSPLESNDVAALEHLVQDATNYRLLQAAIYPVSLAPCHAITFVLAVRAGTLPEELVGRSPEDYLELQVLDAAFENLTGPGQVFADSKVLQLPQDDPGLDAFTRGGFNTVEEARWWVNENFANYWVPHDGCDAYVSIVVFGDTDQGGGIGMYDVRQGQRIAISTDGVLNRQLNGFERQQTPVGTVGRAPSRYSYEMPMLLFAHEGGHLIGQRHPHDIDQEDAYLADSAFSSVYSVMSYQIGDRTVDFGAIDHANWWRNRLGFALQQASADGHDGSPEVAAALLHAATYDWEQAYWDLAPLLPPGGPR